MRFHLLVLSLVCGVLSSPSFAQNSKSETSSARRGAIALLGQESTAKTVEKPSVPPDASKSAVLDKLEKAPPSYLDLIGPLLSKSHEAATKSRMKDAEIPQGEGPKLQAAVPSKDPENNLPIIRIAQQQTDAQIQPAQTKPLAAAEQESSRSSQAADVEATPPVAEEDHFDYLGESLEMADLSEVRDHVRRTLIHYHSEPESANTRSPWGIMHALIAYGVDTEIISGRQKVNAIGWLCWNGQCRGQRLLALQNGSLAVNVGPGVQGHTGQFLAMLAQSRVPQDFEIKVSGKSYTVADLIAYEQATCRPKTELTFKLIALSHYLPSDAEWTSNDGQSWSIPRLIREELAQPVIGAACGGTHRLMGFTYAVENRIKDGKPVDGEWGRAQVFLSDFLEYTLRLQNPDGSFSTQWFERREAREDSQRRVQTTGHILEWLVCALPEEKLRSPEIVKAVAYLSNLMYQERRTEWEIGPKGHALHALNLYDQRVFGARIGQGGPRMKWDQNSTVQR